MSVLVIAQREVKALFSTTIGWVVLCGYVLLAGMFWLAMVVNYVQESQNVVFNPYGAALLNLRDHLLMPFFGNLTVLLIFVIPALSMRLFSEEYRQRTIELLLTAPITTGEIVLGKYLGALSFVGIMFLATAHLPISLTFWASPDAGMLAAGYLALLLMSAALLAVGMLASSFTQNQIAALMAAFAAALGLYVGHWIAGDPDGWVAHLTLIPHVEDLLRGNLRLSDLVYFAVLITVSLVATHQRMESFRWR